MRKLLVLFLLAAVGVAGAEERYLELGRQRLAIAGKRKTSAAKLKHVRAARYYLAKAGKAGKADLVRAFTFEAGIYYTRKSLSLALKRVDAALKLAPADKAALRLRAAIKKAGDEDIYDGVEGAVAIDRIRARRLANGIPLRNRGAARRR